MCVCVCAEGGDVCVHISLLLKENACIFSHSACTHMYILYSYVYTSVWVIIYTVHSYYAMLILYIPTVCVGQQNG